MGTGSQYIVDENAYFVQILQN